MRSYRLFTPLLLVSAVTACSDGGSSKPDAFIVMADAPTDNPPPPPGCEYGELHDDSNDDAVQTGFPEDSQVSFGGSAVFCGSFNVARYDGTTKEVDADAYTFTMPADGNLYISIYGAGLETLSEVDLQIYSGQSFANLSASGIFAVNHGAVSVSLASGTYEIYVRAYNPAAPATDVGYKVKMVPDDLDTRCVPLTTGGYTETLDLATSNLGNDMIGIDFDATDPAMFQIFTTSSSDMAEPSMLTIAATGSSRLSGSAEGTNVVAGSYKDRDTFEITTGAMTNEISLRTGWSATGADLDLFLFEKPVAGAPSPIEVADSAFGGVGPNEEILTTAVKPNTSYWVWIGSYSDPGGTGAYSTTLCGRTYTPPAP